MSNKQAILSELTDMTELISTARDRLAHNELIKIKDINSKVRGMVESIADLPPEEAIEMKPHLVALLEDFKLFSEEMQSKITEIAEANAAKEDAGA